MSTNNKYTLIYSLSCPISGVVKYIGKADNINKRYSKHLCENTSTLKNNWIKSLLKKKLKPKIEVLDEVLISEWQFWESYWISQFKAWRFNLKNMTNGGDGGDIFSKLDKKTQKRIKRKISLANMNKKITNETREKLKIIGKNRKYSKETREKIRISKLGKFGKEHKASIPVCQLNKDGKLIKEFFGISEASRETGIPSGNISKVCNNERFSAGGYIWKYKDDNKKPKKEKYVDGHLTPIMQMDLNGVLINKFDSIKEAVIKTNSSQSCISECLKDGGKQKTHNGFIWKKINK